MLNYFADDARKTIKNSTYTRGLKTLQVSGGEKTVQNLTKTDLKSRISLENKLFLQLLERNYCLLTLSLLCAPVFISVFDCKISKLKRQINGVQIKLIFLYCKITIVLLFILEKWQPL